MRRIIASVAVAVLALGAAAAQADNIYVSIKGSKQGAFKGDAKEEKLRDKIVGLKFRYEVGSPTDLASGRATGRRQHKPIVITKEWGAASPQLFSALVNNEVLPEVIIDFVGVNIQGEMALTHTIRLVNARVIDIAHSTEPASGPGKIGQRHLEDVSFSFQRIDLEDRVGKTAATDSLGPP